MNSPPFLVSFSSIDLLLEALPDEVRESYGADFRNLAEKGLPPVVSIRCLATLFGYSPRFMGALYQRPHRYYRTFSIPKGNKFRIIHAPKVALKVIQKWFGFHLAGVVEVFITLSFISPIPPTITQAFILESVNRIINVAFKFVPLRAGVDEGGTGQVSKVLGFAIGIGETLAIVRKGREIFWSSIGVALIWKRGHGLARMITDPDIKKEIS